MAVTTCFPARSAASTESLATPLLAADQLDENVDRGILRQRHGVVDKTEARNVGITFLAPVERRHGHDLDRPADALGKSRSMRREQP